MKLAVLPVESPRFPDLAARVNKLLVALRLPDVDDYFDSRATLDVAQLAVECPDETNSCYTAVGKSMYAQRLLFGRISRPGKKKAVEVAFTLFDVEASSPITVEQHTYKSEQEAADGVRAQLEKLAPGASL